ncbi:MAG: 50S ribosomal protein L11 methyltransferase [Pseudomonadales bacterium]|nr:50S ribosomal protein L11 methyltransferase [Pseudomonadales bacterium]NIX09714.1 50S ribosomal protein L11 methyltransferase [Pseudomonadales bacterium]
MTWLKLELNVDIDAADELSDRLLGLGAVSVSLAPFSDELLYEPAPGETPLWRRSRLSALFAAESDLEEARRVLAAHGDVEEGFVEDQDWVDAWRSSAVAQCFGGRLWVVPRDAEPRDGVILRLDPGLAFGTGAHPTTRLCLEWLASHDLTGQRLVDYGCGSGILGIAGALLGAAEVLAVDHDAQALLATRENARANGVEPGRLRVVSPEQVPDQDDYDVLVANILANPLMDLASRFTDLIRPGGMIVLSGLLAGQASDVVAGYPAFRFADPQADGDWVLLMGRKRGR